MSAVPHLLNKTNTRKTREQEKPPKPSSQRRKGHRSERLSSPIPLAWPGTLAHGSGRSHTTGHKSQCRTSGGRHKPCPCPSRHRRGTQQAGALGRKKNGMNEAIVGTHSGIRARGVRTQVGESHPLHNGMPGVRTQVGECHLSRGETHFLTPPAVGMTSPGHRARHLRPLGAGRNPPHNADRRGEKGHRLQEVIPQRRRPPFGK